MREQFSPASLGAEEFVKLMGALMERSLDRGTDSFDPSNLEFTSIDIGNTTVNLIPGEARARFNIRFNDTHPSVAWLKFAALAEGARLASRQLWGRS